MSVRQDDALFQYPVAVTKTQKHHDDVNENDSDDLDDDDDDDDDDECILTMSL